MIYRGTSVGIGLGEVVLGIFAACLVVWLVIVVLQALLVLAAVALLAVALWTLAWWVRDRWYLPRRERVLSGDEVAERLYPRRP